ncbi:response regulator [Paenibacillus oralis]|uniref:Response regulator n=1 Tax=Paenibacillus oralis TaxID=2490856 RepID=A0A3P3TXJ8_9BACL|nr:response regulator [Paenibacillus oralis]RRJ62560.1 response regulator [Paenibacillus oralis]
MAFKVLLIDDEPGAIEGMQLWIDWRGLGFEVCGTCGNGAEGLEMIEKLEPDLVVTDVRMPVLDGLGMIEMWQRSGSRPVRFAIVSGYSDFQYAQKALRFGVTHYFLKPIDEEAAAKELAVIYEELLQERELQRISRIASLEETVFRIKKLLTEPPGLPPELERDAEAVEERSASVGLEGLSSLREAWNFCLIRTVPGRRAELREIAASLAAGEEAMVLVDLETGEFGLVFGYAPGADGEDGIARIRELARRYAGRPALLALGAGEPSLGGLHACFRGAHKAMPHNFYAEGYPAIARDRQVRLRSFDCRYDQADWIDRVLEAVQLLDQAGLRKAAQEAAVRFRERYIDPDIVMKLVVHLFYNIAEQLREALGDKANPLIDRNAAPWAPEALTVEELLGELVSFGADGIHLLLEETFRSSRGIVQEINRYIGEHYREGLTIKKLAEVFYLHPVYLGQLLMKKNGIHFNGMIHDLRIEEAARLLRENKLKNSEVAERVGYANYGQFLKQFEKRLGMSPNEYRSRN